jgi:uncharacterized membrane protein YraQ (UPF0718 family)/copper chaperone CopZ
VVWLELSPWMLLGMAVAAVLHVALPTGFVERQLTGFGGVLKAIGVGVPLPLCSCGVIPAGLGLKKDGASDGASVGFLIATPQTGVDSLLVSASFLGWPFAVFKLASAALTGAIGGALTERFGGPRQPIGDDAEAESPAGSPPRGVRAAFDHATEVLAAIWRWLIFGVVVAAAITTLVPQEALSTLWSAGGAVSALAVLAISLPMYVCATASVPIAAALVASGMPLGAALVFLMAGPATNVATIGAIFRGFGSRVLGIYLGTIIVGSLGFGWAFDFVLAGGPAAAPHHHHHGAAWWSIASGVLLAGLIGWLAVGDLRRFLASRRPVESTALSIPVDGMTCGGCARKVEGALCAIDGVESARVDLEGKRAIVTGRVRRADAEAAITSAGFTPR